MSGKDARYFIHDDNAHNDPKSIALMNKYGVEGYGRFWIIVELMRRESFYRLSDKPLTWNALSGLFKISIQETKQFVKDCIEEFELFKSDNGFIYSDSLLARMAKLDSMRMSRVKGGYKRHKIDIPEDYELED